MSDGIKVFKLGKQIRNVGRLSQIASVFAKHGFGTLLEQLGIDDFFTTDILRKIRRIYPLISQGQDTNGLMGVATHFRKALEELGPAFVKIGQFLSVREDLLPLAFIDELKKLQTTVEPVPHTVVQKILERELGDLAKSKFQHIEKDTLASGSIGLVYLAKLKTGDELVLKIQRPNIENQIKTDLDLMELIAGLIEKHIPELRAFRPVMMLREFKRSILSELDFVREAASTMRVKANFRDNPYVVCPEVYWEFSTSHILAQSYMSGRSLTHAEGLESEGLEPKLLLDRAVGCFLQMVFVDGFYHGDLHPGNLLALSGNRIGLIDFGVTIKISTQTRRHLAGLLVAFVKEDYESLVRHFIELSDPSADFDHYAFTGEVGNVLSPYMGLKVKDMHSGRLLWKTASLSAKYGAPMPTDLVLFLRTLATLEGVVKNLDPSYNIIQACQNFTEDLVKDLYSTENLKKEVMVIGLDVAHLLRHAPFQLRQLLKRATDGDLRFRVESDAVITMARSLDRASARVAVSMIASGFFLGASILADSRTLGFLDPTMLVVVGFAVAGVLAIMVILSIMR